MTDHRARVLRIERTFDAPVARVFEAWTSEEVLRIRGYLTAQGAKLSPEQLIGRVQEATAKLREAADSVPPTRFTDPPAPGEWSANEVMAHVVEAGRHFGDAIVHLFAPAERAYYNLESLWAKGVSVVHIQ